MKDIFLKENESTFTGNNSVKICCPKMGLLKKIESKFFPLKVDPLFRRTFMYRKPNRKSQELSPLRKMAENAYPDFLILPERELRFHSDCL